MTTTTIRNQRDMQAFVDEIAGATPKIRWEAHLADESEKLDRVYGRYFASKTGPDGSQWAKNAKSTIKAKGHARQLFGKPSLGFRLHKSLTTRNGAFSVRYEIDHWPERATLIHGTDAPYSVYNDQGTRFIPARRHIGISGQYFDGVAQRGVDYAFDRFKKLLA
jgi:hypothetical protein